jgi:hypothetical protein
MQINIVYDPSVANAPAGFTTAITDAVNFLDKLFTNPISITIDVGYGEVDGLQLDSNALGEGTLFASGIDSTVDITGILNGGKAEVGNGVVDISNLSSEAIIFDASGTGGLLLDNAIYYTGKVSGFGANTTQFIDLTNVTYDASVSCIYTPNATNPTEKGVLTVTSGSQIVAKIHMLGDYNTANFTLTADSSGHVQITDPPTVVQQSSASGNVGGSVTDGAHTASIPLIGVIGAIEGDAGALIRDAYHGHPGQF